MAEVVKDDAGSAAGSDVQQGSKQGLLQAPFFVPVVFDPASGIPMIPLYPSPQAENPQQGGIFAVPMLPFCAGSSSLPPIPLTYNPPLGIPYGESPEAGTAGTAENAAQQADGAPRADQQRVVVRRFRVGIQLDLLLIVKLVTMVFIFSQDGSRDRLLLLFLASVVYLYQTGALTPLLRWASERARRAMMPPLQVPREAPQLANDADPVVGDGNLAGPAAGGDGAQVGPLPAQDAARGEHEVAGEAQVPHVDEQQQQQAHVGNWRGFMREVQMVVVGFVTSLLPGFHNID